jgi:acetylornithine/succinyldiaminopimelate/putrescine aminotransferase
VVDVLLQGAVLENCVAMGAHLRAGLGELARKHGVIRQVRGPGLLVGTELDRPGAPIVDRCREAGLLINCTGDKVLRFTPPLIVTRAEVDEALDILDGALAA